MGPPLRRSLLGKSAKELPPLVRGTVVQRRRAANRPVERVAAEVATTLVPRVDRLVKVGGEAVAVGDLEAVLELLGTPQRSMAQYARFCLAHRRETHRFCLRVCALGRSIDPPHTARHLGGNVLLPQGPQIDTVVIPPDCHYLAHAISLRGHPQLRLDVSRVCVPRAALVFPLELARGPWPGSTSDATALDVEFAFSMLAAVRTNAGASCSATIHRGSSDPPVAAGRAGGPKPRQAASAVAPRRVLYRQYIAPPRAPDRIENTASTV